MQVRLLLPGGSDAAHAHQSDQVPCGLLLWERDLPPCPVQLRVQVPGGIVCTHRQPASVLHPEPTGNEPDAVPDRAQVRQACDVRRDPLSKRDLRDLQGEEGMRPVPQGQVLPDGHQVGAVPGGVFLRGGSGLADQVPCQPLLPARVVGADRLQGGSDVG